MVALMVVASIPNFAQNSCTSNYVDLRKIAIGMGWKVTSEMGGGHNAHSRHYVGKAIDVSVRGKSEFDIIALWTIMDRYGYIFRDERVRPKGQRVWKGKHIHLAVKDCQ